MAGKIAGLWCCFFLAWQAHWGLALAQDTAVLQEADQQPNAHVNFESLDPIKKQQVLAAILGGTALPKFEGLRHVFEERSHMEAWEGNWPELKARVDKLIIRMRRATPEEDGRQRVDSFELSVEFEAKQTVVRSNAVRRAKYRGGVALPGSQEWRVFIGGTSQAGVALLSPEFAPAADQMRALLFCPRYIETQRMEGGKKQSWLADSGYRLNRALFAVSGEAHGRALSGIDIGLARAAILTTPNIPRSVEYFDETYMKDPRISLVYRPYTSEILTEHGEQEAITAAIQASIEFQRASGHRRLSTARNIVWIQEVELQLGQEWFANVDDSSKMAVASGACYLILGESSLEHRFSREKFKLPPRLQPTPAAEAQSSGS